MRKGYVAVFCRALMMSVLAVAVGVLWGLVAQEAPTSALHLTEIEQVKLDNLQVRLRAIRAEYAAAMSQLTLDEQMYVSGVLTAHPGVQATFDPQSMSWVRVVGATGGSGSPIKNVVK